MLVTLWHFTYAANVESILAEGFRNPRLDRTTVQFGVPGSTHWRVNHDALIEATLQLTEEERLRYEAESVDPQDGYRCVLWTIPTAVVNDRTVSKRLVPPEEWKR